MSKIICDVCGTSYPESATQCPICGCVRPSDPDPVLTTEADQEARQSGTYTYVKGGRFSKANVKKRNQGLPVNVSQPIDSEEVDEEKKNDKGFIIAVALLLAAILAVIIYIVIRFLAPSIADADPTTPTLPTIQTQPTTETTQEPTKPCTSLRLSVPTIEFTNAGDSIYIKVTKDPVDTTDVLEFSSSNVNVATVDANGKVTAVGPGNATITVTCGTAKAMCTVVCNLETESTTETTEATEPEETTAPTTPVTFELNREDFTLFAKGETWRLYNGDIPADQIKWSSDDETVATIDKGVVTAVGPGVTYVRGEYAGVKRSCKVICRFPSTEEPTVPDETTEPDEQVQCIISHSDVTIAIGESFDLTLRNPDGSPAFVTWTVADSSICSVSNNRITGKASGKTTVSATYNGVTYTCIVRVR